MSLVAVGIYLKILRSARDLTQEAVAEALNVSPEMVGKWERGRNEPSPTNLHRFISLVHGSLDQVFALLIDKNATPADGVRAAGEWLTSSQRARLVALVDEIETEEELEALIAAWRQAHGGDARGGTPR